MSSEINNNNAFDGINRLFGNDACDILKDAHICVIGLGGVGSWVVEALARTGVGKLTLIDYDEVASSNINRQLHALHSTIGSKKTTAMRDRVMDINPQCTCNIIDDYFTIENQWELLSADHHYDYVIDAIDSIKFKAAIIYFCKRNKIPVITTGGAGGVTDTTSIQVKDLSRTYNDALAARVRSVLRAEYNFSKNPKRYFGVECIFSVQQKLYPKEDGKVTTSKPGIHGVHLDCRFGYGSVSFVTATFGLMAVSRVINKLLDKKRSR